MSTKQFTLRVGFAIALCLVFLSCAFDASLLLQAQTPDGQSKRPASSSAVPSSASAQEFSVTMRQNVVAGKTPVGTKVEAKLTIATLLKGAVIPQGAIFS